MAAKSDSWATRFCLAASKVMAIADREALEGWELTVAHGATPKGSGRVGFAENEAGSGF